MPKSLDQMATKPGNNPYEVDVSKTFMPDGGEQVNLKTKQGGLQLNMDASGNVTVTERNKLNMSEILPFVSTQPLAAAMDSVFGTKMGGAMPSQAQLMQQYNAMEQAPLDRELMRKKIESYGQITPYQKEMLKLKEAELARKGEGGGLTPYQVESLKMQQEKLQLDKDLKKSQAEEKEARKKQIEENKVKDYGKWISQSGIPELNQTLNEITAITSRHKDLPGYGQTGWVPEFALSSEGKKLRSQIGNLFNVVLKDRSGAAVTDQELTRLKNEFLTNKWNTDEDIRTGLEQYKNRLVEVVRNINAASPEEAVEGYKKKGRDYLGEINSYAFSEGAKNKKPGLPAGLTPEEEAELAELEAMEAASRAGN